METWKESKSRFLKFMNGPVYESDVPVTFTLDADARKRAISSFIEWVYNDIGETMGEFIASQREGFYDNKVVEPFYMPGDDEEVIPAGMKLSKAVGKYFTGLYDASEIDVVQTEISMLIQQNCIRGKLCLSVHPLDFLSSSENNHNWRSCHALDGDYRAGNMSYMLDNCTVMAYLKSDKPDGPLPRFPSDVPWNDKKWRCLFHFDFNRGIVWAGRQYPFSTKVALDNVVNLFNQVHFFSEDYRGLNPFNTWEDRVIKSDTTIDGHEVYLREPYYITHNGIYSLKDFVDKGNYSLNFNDVLDSSYYKPLNYHFKGCSNEKYLCGLPILIGKAAHCVHCGKNHIFPNATFLCEDCMLEHTHLDNEDVGYCHQCGRHIVYNLDYNYDNEYYCADCFNELFQSCHSCSMTYPVSVMDPDDDGNFYCQTCLSNHSQEEENWEPLLWEP